VATDIAARGIDVSNISHVINFDVPATVDAYTHRIGRTGRATCTGAALTFASREDRKIISQIERALGSKLAWINTPARLDKAPDRTPQAAKPAKKPFNNSRKSSRPSRQYNRGRGEGNSPFTDERKQRQVSARPSKSGSRQKKNRRAAIMIDGAGNFFLNP